MPDLQSRDIVGFADPTRVRYRIIYNNNLSPFQNKVAILILTPEVLSQPKNIKQYANSDLTTIPFPTSASAHLARDCLYISN